MVNFIIISIYLLSVFLSYRYVQIGYSKGGRYENGTPSTFELWFTFIPIFNTIICGVSWICLYPVKLERRKLDLTKFFNIKK